MTTLVWCANERYAPGMETALRALARSGCFAIGAEVAIIDVGLAKATVDRLHDVAGQVPGLKLHVIPAPLERFKSVVLVRYHVSSYVRLAIPELVACDRALYLDSDALPFADPLGDTWFQETGGRPVAAAADWETLKPSQDSPEIAAATGLQDCTTYFNAGVLGMRLDLLREECFTDRACELLHKMGQHAGFADQTAFNALLAERWDKLKPHWNTPAWAFDQQDDNRLPGILHFTNRAPWLVRRWAPSNALFERMADELGVKLPLPEQGVGRSLLNAARDWLAAPLRVAWHGARAIMTQKAGDNTASAGHAHVAAYWWRYFVGGPSRVLRYRRRIREIRDPGFRIFPNGTHESPPPQHP